MIPKNIFIILVILFILYLLSINCNQNENFGIGICDNIDHATWLHAYDGNAGAIGVFLLSKGVTIEQIGDHTQYTNITRDLFNAGKITEDDCKQLKELAQKNKNKNINRPIQ